jgi:hypothetical protein
MEAIGNDAVATKLATLPLQSMTSAAGDWVDVNPVALATSFTWVPPAETFFPASAVGSSPLWAVPSSSTSLSVVFSTFDVESLAAAACDSFFCFFKDGSNVSTRSTGCSTVLSFIFAGPAICDAGRFKTAALCEPPVFFNVLGMTLYNNQLTNVSKWYTLQKGKHSQV